jgi:hypothetical protein
VVFRCFEQVDGKVKYRTNYPVDMNNNNFVGALNNNEALRLLGQSAVVEPEVEPNLPGPDLPDSLPEPNLPEGVAVASSFSGETRRQVRVLRSVGRLASGLRLRCGEFLPSLWDIIMLDVVAIYDFFKGFFIPSMDLDFLVNVCTPVRDLAFFKGNFTPIQDPIK